MMIPGEGGNVDIQSRNRVNRVSQNQQNICLRLFVQCNMCRRSSFCLVAQQKTNSSLAPKKKLLTIPGHLSVPILFYLCLFFVSDETRFLEQKA